MKDSGCIDVCEKIIERLRALGYRVGNFDDHEDILKALGECKLVKDKDDNNRLIIQIDVKQFIKDNFEDELPEDEQLIEQKAQEFMQTLEEVLSDWIKSEWSGFINNEGD